MGDEGSFTVLGSGRGSNASPASGLQPSVLARAAAGLYGAAAPADPSAVQPQRSVLGFACAPVPVTASAAEPFREEVSSAEAAAAHASVLLRAAAVPGTTNRSAALVPPRDAAAVVPCASGGFVRNRSSSEEQGGNQEPSSTPSSPRNSFKKSKGGGSFKNRSDTSPAASPSGSFTRGTGGSFKKKRDGSGGVPGMAPVSVLAAVSRLSSSGRISDRIEEEGAHTREHATPGKVPLSALGVGAAPSSRRLPLTSLGSAPGAVAAGSGSDSDSLSSDDFDDDLSSSEEPSGSSDDAAAAADDRKAGGCDDKPVATGDQPPATAAAAAPPAAPAQEDDLARADSLKFRAHPATQRAMALLERADAAVKPNMRPRASSPLAPPPAPEPLQETAATGLLADRYAATFGEGGLSGTSLRYVAASQSDAANHPDVPHASLRLPQVDHRGLVAKRAQRLLPRVSGWRLRGRD